jgi:DNA-directed RNA polymerase subunit RPC12/RpoP
VGYKKVCFKCRKAFSIYKIAKDPVNPKCPNCGGKAVIFNHKFRPPKQNDLDKCGLIKFLSDNGFVYQHVFLQVDEGSLAEAPYPKNLKEAKSFVKKFRNQAHTDNSVF